MTVEPDDFRTLMTKALAGCPDAAERLCKTYQAHILRVVRRRLMRRLRSRFDSLDMVHDVWVSFFAKPPQQQRFTDPQAFIGYLERMAEFKIGERLRQQTGLKNNVLREKPLDAPDIDPDRHLIARQPTPSQEFLAREQWEHLVGGLRPRQQRILQLLRQGMTHREIAERLSIDEKTVRRLVSRLETETPDL
jgi:RNA polymerase sigma factor (sigma-70 family)